MDERLKFVACLLEGESMSSLCREFGISRKTGYKIFNRYKECGLRGLSDRSRRSYRHANQLSLQSTVLAGQKVEISQIDDKIWLVSFMKYDLGYSDMESRRLEPISNPFDSKVLPMCLV